MCIGSCGVPAGARTKHKTRAGYFVHLSERRFARNHMPPRSTFPKPYGSPGQPGALLSLVRLLARQAAREASYRALEHEDKDKDAVDPVAGRSPHE